MSDGGGDPRGELEKRLAEAERRAREAEAERDEAREREATKAEILRIIAASPGDPQPVFEAIVESARRLLGGHTGIMTRIEGDFAHFLAATSVDAEADAAMRATFPRPAPDLASDFGARLLNDGFAERPDTETDFRGPMLAQARARGFRSSLSVLLRVGGASFGVLAVTRREPGRFSPAHIALLRSFADQAVIAIENARLFNEAQARTRELAETLRHQQSAAEVLQVVGESVADPAPVFEKIVESCGRLFQGMMNTVFLVDDAERLTVAAVSGPDPQINERFRAEFPVPFAGTVSELAFRERRVVTIADVWNDPRAPEALRSRAKRVGQNASMAIAPMIWGDRPIGSVQIHRADMRPFDEGERRLMQTFADQAVIAIQNARLFSDTQEALERQTATAEILKVIASSPGDPQPVFDAIVESARRLLGGYSAAMLRVEGDMIHHQASTSVDPAADAAMRATFPRPVPEFGARTLRDGFAEVVDTETELQGPSLAHARARDMRSFITVLLKVGGENFGTLAVSRREPGRFSPAHIALLRAFADQAAIAIENARLFNETQRALERQTATSEILKVIAASPSDTTPVFDAIAHSANRLLGGLSTTVWRFEGEICHLAAFTPTNPEADAELRALSPLPVTRLSAFVLLRGGEIAKLTDTEQGPPELRDLARMRGYRSMLFVPLILSDEAIGFVSVTRKQPGEFDPDDVQLLKTFADQAVIAIQNARLFNETKEALEQQKASADVLGAIGRSVSDAAPVFEQILDACYRLFGLDEMGIYTVDSDDMVRVAAWRGETRAEVRRDVSPLAESVTGRVIRERRTHHIPNLLEDPHISPKVRERAERLGNASLLYAPMLWEERGLGSILVVRSPPKPFSERETELLKTFADQAAIAIENARLFNETKEALERLTTTTEILKAIANSPANAQPVFESIVVSAARRLKCDLAFVMLCDDKTYSPVAAANPDGLTKLMGPLDLPIDPDANFPSRAIVGKATYYLPDWSQIELPPHERAIHELLGLSSALYMPLLRGDVCRGVLTLARFRASGFSAGDIAEAEAFRDQAVIALENARLFNETREALERQQATGEILSAIGQSVSDAAPVFEKVLDACERIFASHGAGIFLAGDDGMVRAAAARGAQAKEVMRDVTPLPNSITAKVIASRTVHHIPDEAALPNLSERMQERVRKIGPSSLLYAPMLWKDRGLGSIVVTRTPPRPFNEKEQALLQSFADQAAIAIENARLFNDTQKALERQTATAEILKVIARSPSDTQPVFEAIVESAKRLLGGLTAVCTRNIDDKAHLAAFTPINPEEDAARAARFPVGRDDPVFASQLEGRSLLISDTETHEGMKFLREPARRVGLRSFVSVPLMSQGTAIGGLSVSHTGVGAFAEEDVELLRTFADQAVIAIENAKLFAEVQAKTRDLEETLAYQIATSDVLSAIGGSMSDAQPVFQRIVDSLARLLEHDVVAIFLAPGDGLVHVAAFSGPNSQALQQVYPRPVEGSAIPVVLETRRQTYFPDVLNGPDVPESLRQSAHAVGRNYANVITPMIWEGRGVGVISVVRAPFATYSERELGLLRTFADQAVIAIENARLFNETQARTRELAASLDDLRRTQDRLVQTEKLASLGQLTAGIAHEIKNPLNFVNNFAALTGELADELLEVLAPAPLDAKTRDEVDDLAQTIKDNLQKVVHHGKRADSIVKNMLLHSRTGASEHRPTDINSILEESLNLAYHGARAEKPGFNITMKRDLDPSAGVADVFPQEVSRAFLNLISNGFYAAAKRAQGGEVEPELLVATKNLGESVEVRIRDNGTGIPDEIREKIFNPFFTTKPAGEGTGLGLSMTHDIIVKQHGGALDVESSPGSYTEFRIVLPRRGAPVQQGERH